MEALMFMLDCAVMVAVVYMGLRDDRRSARTPASSLFRTRDRAGDQGVDGGGPAALAPPAFEPFR